MRSKTIVGRSVLLLLALLAAFYALAMTSTNYELFWFVPLDGSGGGPAQSASYKINFTIGQFAIGGAASTNYKANLGYWPGLPGPYASYMPVIRKSADASLGAPAAPGQDRPAEAAAQASQVVPAETAEAQR